MMSIAKVSNLKYHLEHSQYDYYSENENEKGEFRGALMKWQKLEGKEVDEKNYMKQIAHGGEDNKGVDLCFSPPKDWTLLYNRVDDETRLKMDGIRDKAVSSIVKGIEQNTYYRETNDGVTEYKLAKGVGMATFNHHSGREVNDKGINPDGYVDCQEHTHITVFPKVLGQDGKFHSHTLLEMKYEKGNDHESLRYLDQLGQYELCKGLQELGFETYELDEHGNFGIKGIDENVRNEFSKRKQQINDKAEEGASYNDKQKISLKFRVSKDDHDLADLRKHWQEKMNDAGFTEDKIKEMRTGKTNHQDRKLDDLLSDKDKDKTLSNKKLKTLALRESKYGNKSYKDKLEEFKGDKKVRPVSKKYNIYANNKAKEKLCDRVDKLKQDRKIKGKDFKNNNNNLSSSNGGKGVESGAKIGKQAVQGATKALQGTGGKKPSITPTAQAGGSSSGGGSKQELYSSIKDLEQQLFSFPPIAERTPEQHKQIAQIESQIGDLKEQIKKIEEQEKQTQGTSPSSGGGSSSGGSGGGSKGQQQQQQQQQQTPEEREEYLLNEKANDIIDLTNKEDKIKDSNGNKKLDDIQKGFNKEHKEIVNDLVKSQQVQLQI